ncbi:MAG: cupin [Flavobacteriia bacterium]|nr:MAG: cupin [Flavobacteriia bacterium]
MKQAAFYDDMTFNPTKVTTKLILETDTSKEVRIMMASGLEMKKHQTSYPITVHLLKGRISFGVNDEKLQLKEGDIIALDADIPHSLSALEDSVVRLTLSKNDPIQRVEKVISL